MSGNAYWVLAALFSTCNPHFVNDGPAPAPVATGAAGAPHTVAPETVLTSAGAPSANAPTASARRTQGGGRLSLKPGVWTDITPPAPGFKGTFGSPCLALSPIDPATLYVPIDTLGLWKTTDGGATWKRLGDPSKVGENDTSYLDSPVRVEVDPRDGKHLYATQGVRGTALGFWVSHDGGDTWKKPAGFVAISARTTNDVTMLAVDPTDFRHILLGSHSSWPGIPNAGILESKDGGETFTVHPPVASWPTGSMGLEFLYDPASHQGNPGTWLVMTDGDGFWRTTNSGGAWTKVGSHSVGHGGSNIYYARNGTVYAGATPFPLRSKDNGATWEQLQKGLKWWYYYTVYGDGKTLYTQLSYTGDNGGQGLQPYLISPETDGTTFTPYEGGAQTFSNGPFMMRFDAKNRIMYSANWRAGIFALKLRDS